MPSDISEQVAADHSAAAETPVEGTNALGEAEGVEEFNPPTAEPAPQFPETGRFPVPSTGDQQPAEADQSQGLSTEVKEEFQEARSTGACSWRFISGGRWRQRRDGRGSC